MTTLQGRTYGLKNASLRYYYGTREYWYSTRTSRPRLQSAENHVLIIQGPLWPQVALEEVESIVAIQAGKESGSGTQQTFESGVFGQEFSLKTFSPAFTIRLKNGASFRANMEGTIEGVGRVGSFEGRFTTPVAEVAKLLPAPDGSVTVESKEGTSRQNIRQLKVITETPWDEIDYDVEKKLTIVIDRPDRPPKMGGVTVTLAIPDLQGRNVSFRRVKKDGGQFDDESFLVEGLSAKARTCALGRILDARETFVSDLMYVVGRAEMDGRTTSVFLRAADLAEFSVQSMKGSLAMTSILDTKGLRIPRMDVSKFFYSIAASQFNVADEKKTFRFISSGIEVEIPFSSVEMISREHDGRVTLTLNNSGEKHTGRFHGDEDDRRPYALSGEVVDSEFGLPSRACFLLRHIASLEVLRKESGPDGD